MGTNKPHPGWLVEHSGRVWATLTEPRFEDMFWVSYTITPMQEQEAAVLFTEAFWARDDLVFRHRETRELAEGAFSAINSAPTPESPRVSMRALSIKTK